MIKRQSIPFMIRVLTLIAVFSLAACSSSSPPTTVTDSTGATPSGTAASTLALTKAKLNLNLATADEFLTVPNVGNRMVREFMEYRPYTSILQFRREIGKYVDAAQVAAYEQYVFVPVAINTADAETLKQLPGIDEALAAQLIAGRPYASNDDFLIRLTTYAAKADTAAVAPYLTTQ